MKKVRKTTRPLRYDLKPIPYNYTVEARSRFKVLDLMDRVPDELWIKVCDVVQKAVIKTIAKRKKCKKAKWLSGFENKCIGNNPLNLFLTSTV